MIYGVGKSICLFDFDNTIYKGHSFFPLAKYLADQGVMESAVWDRIAGELETYKKGLQNYVELVGHLFAHLGEGLRGKKYIEALEKNK